MVAADFFQCDGAGLVAAAAACGGWVSGWELLEWGDWDWVAHVEACKALVLVGELNVRWTLAGLLLTFDFPPFVLRALVGVASSPVVGSAAGTAAVLRALFFCALPGTVLRACLGGIVLYEKCAVGIFRSGVLKAIN